MPAMSGIKLLRFVSPDTDAKPRSEMKSAARAKIALDPDVAIHQLDEFFGNRKSETSASVLSGGGAVGLAEGLEQAGRLFGRHADASCHARKISDSLCPEPFPPGATRHNDLATFGEFHRIVDEIDQDLTETQRVSNEIRRQILLRSDEEFQISCRGFLADHAGDSSRAHHRDGNPSSPYPTCRPRSWRNRECR